MSLPGRADDDVLGRAARDEQADQGPGKRPERMSRRQQLGIGDVERGANPPVGYRAREGRGVDHAAARDVDQ